MASPFESSSAYYDAPISSFLSVSNESIVGALTLASSHEVDQTQVQAWNESIDVLRRSLAETDGHVLLEFDVPRLGSRIDAVVIAGRALVPIEFKVGSSHFAAEAIEQVWDYALDLKNFHDASRGAAIFPILVATEADWSDSLWPSKNDDGVREPRRVAALDLRLAILQAVELADGVPLDGARWGRGKYNPTPTIVEAARALYARHSVDAISRSDASAKNLRVTGSTVEKIISDSQREGWKSLVLLTGVPGAGKTLVGLNVATRHRRSVEVDPTHAVFLSGNGPLVKVLHEALTRDELDRLRRTGMKVRKGDVAQKVKPFIQAVHHFRDAGLKSSSPPIDHVIVFDEAQRAWNAQKLSSFMATKKRLAGFTMSEPESQLDYMDRRQDWAVAICLVGGGQEIHDGEAGIGEWIRAVQSRFPHWHVFVSSRLVDSEYASGDALAQLNARPNVQWSDDLHLSVSMRSFRAERVSGFVKAVLDRDVAAAQQLYRELRPKYPLVISRDLERAKAWVRAHARGSERFGLVASSKAERLKPHAIDIRATIDPVHWFLDPATDTRSSFYLEDAATEFQVQGLELDWVCATWDADLRMQDGKWAHRQFRGSSWIRVKQPTAQQYLVNAYRVLLTRARQGMAIFVPPGAKSDPTRNPEYYDETFNYLASLGIEVL